MGEERELPAGAFSAWLGDMQAALRGERDADVPCGGCSACCTSSQFVHIGPDETDAHRPRTCRTYDCRVLPAAGIGIDPDDEGLIARRARRFTFDFPEEADRV